ncbi:hypothetical protein [Paraglaciecola sp. 20A4]|uniref:hypothetical protein n=1 Tax=Paraglaciecola sp. 20A4 TaxID=2687288 RepID=UPI00140A52E3|nr:hypothetical protein [Paraglaciecola sp. 20A4]
MSDVVDKNKGLSTDDIHPKGKVRSMSNIKSHWDDKPDLDDYPKTKNSVSESSFPEVFLVLVKALAVALIGVFCIYQGWVLLGLFGIIGAIFYFLMAAGTITAEGPNTFLGQCYTSSASNQQRQSVNSPRSGQKTSSRASNLEASAAVTAAGAGLYASVNNNTLPADDELFEDSYLFEHSSVSDDADPSSHFDDIPIINPATGLPMMGGVDSAGNTYGTDMSTSIIDTDPIDIHTDTCLIGTHIDSSFDDTSSIDTSVDTSIDISDPFDTFDSTSFDDDWMS